MNRFQLLATTAFVAATLPLGALADSKSLVRVATMPAGAEVTGLATNAIGDLFLNAQHPGGKNTFKGAAPQPLSAM